MASAVKINQYKYELPPGVADKPQRFTNLLSYDVRMRVLDIYAIVSTSSTTTLVACILVFVHTREQLRRWKPVSLTSKVMLWPSSSVSLDSRLMTLQSRNRVRQQLLSVALLDVILFLAVLVLTYIVWTLHNDAEQVFDTNNPLLPDHHVDRKVSYGPIPKNRWFTFETWNCVLAPYIAIDHGSYTPRHEISSRCTELLTLRILILPLLVMSSIRAAMSSWIYRDAVAKDASGRSEEASDPLLGPELDARHGLSKQRYANELAVEVPAPYHTELAGSRAGLPEVSGSEVQQLPGDERMAELEAESVAIELPAGRY